MKQFNKKEIINSKKNKKLNYLFLSVIIFCSFFLGNLSNNKLLQIKTFFGDVLDDIGKSIHTNFFITEKIKIDLNFDNYNLLHKSRNKAIEQGMMLAEDNPWISGSININKKKYDLDIKLRGSHLSNWINENKMGYKIKLKKDQRFNGMKEFSIQHPEQREYIGEYLFMKVLESEGLIFSRSNFYNLDINGQNHGLYFLQESPSKEMIENNKRRESIIVGFDKEAYLKKYSNNFKINENFSDIQLEDGFLISEINLSNSTKNFNQNKKEIFTNTLMMLEDFRSNKLKTSEVFDVEKLAKLMAIKAIFGAGEFDWRDIKFYYNPFTLKLEPIGKEVGAGLLSKNAWWSSNPNEINFNTDDISQKSFLSLIFKDEVFFKEYLKELNYFASTGESIINKI